MAVNATGEEVLQVRTSEAMRAASNLFQICAFTQTRLTGNAAVEGEIPSQEESFPVISGDLLFRRPFGRLRSPVKGCVQNL